tara:strand:+ start:7225 stop:7986 length:762 start_codon:yes stop_codon:yes gene_type:complete
MKKITLLMAAFFVAASMNAQYCVPALSDACSPEEINNVNFAGIDNSTGCEPSGYNDFTAIVGEVETGEAYQISVDVIADGSFPQSQLFVFFDWNQDEVWDPSTERYDIAAQPMSSGNYTLFIDVPGDALLGETRMRVAMVYGTGPEQIDYNGCSDYSFGEIEDYTVNVSSLSVADNTIDGFNYFYSVQSKELTVSANIEMTSISIFNLIGQEVIAKNLNSNNEVINLSNLKEGVYLANVIANGQKTTFKLVKR